MSFSLQESEWIKDNFDNYSWKEFTSLFNEKFNVEIPVSTMRKRIEKLGFKKSKEKIFELNCSYTKEQKEFLMNNSKYYLRKELTQKFNEKFNTQKTVNQIKDQLHCLKEQGFVFDSYSTISNSIKENDKMATWLKENSKKYCKSEFCREFNKVFNLSLSDCSILKAASDLNVTDFGSDTRLWTDDMEKLMLENSNLNDKAIADIINEKLNKKLSSAAISDKRIRMNMKKEQRISYDNDRNSFLKEYPVGTEILTSRGLKLKISDKKWVIKKRWVWENYYNEKLKPSDNIINIDGDPTNNEIDNLMKITEKERNIMNGWKIYGLNEVTVAGVEVIRALNEIKEVEANSKKEIV